MSEAHRPSIERVQVILPSSPPRQAGDLEAGYAWLRGAGVEVLEAAALEAADLPFLAATDDDRALTYRDALLDDSLDAVWCGRGGSGALRTLEALDAMGHGARSRRAFAEAVDGARHRPLIGLSDATALLLARAAVGRGGLAIHGPVITQLPRLDPASAEAMRAWLRSPQCLPELHCSPHQRVCPGVAEGDLVVGNLSMIASCVGTPEGIDCQGAILLIEDVAEPAYRLDRMMAQLQRSGAIDGLVGLAFGSFVDCHPVGDVEACLADWGRRLAVPCCGAFPVGHGSACFPVAQGFRYRLCADSGRLTPGESVSEWLARPSSNTDPADVVRGDRG